MNHPNAIKSLIVEDEQAARDHHNAVFDCLKDRFKILPVADPQFVVSFEEAQLKLESDQNFQLVVLDLSIPMKSGRAVQAQGEMSLGLCLLDLCAKRDHRPIPSLLIFTGNAAKTEQSALRARIKRDFAYAELIAKGGIPVPDFLLAIEQTASYMAVDIRHQSNDDDVELTLTPREDDLLRRASLRLEKNGIRYWWEQARVGEERSFAGQALLDNGQVLPRLYSFRFAPAVEHDLVMANARLSEQKDPYFRMVCSIRSGTTMLLITEQIPPVPSPIPTHGTESRDSVVHPNEGRHTTPASVVGVDEHDATPHESLQLGNTTPGKRAALEVPGMMARRAKVVEVTARHRSQCSASALIDELSGCEPEFKNLPSDFVVEIFTHKKGTKRPSNYTLASILTKKVGALGEDPNTDVRDLAHRFEEATRAERKRTVKKHTLD